MTLEVPRTQIVVQHNGYDDLCNSDVLHDALYAWVELFYTPWQKPMNQHENHAVSIFTPL